MHCIGTVQRATRSANDFDPAGQFGIGLEQAIDVGKAGSPQRHTVFQIKKGAGAGATG